MGDNESIERAGPGSPAANNNNGNGGFRRFILDPKASVKTYLVEGLTDGHNQHNNAQINQPQYPYSQASHPPYQDPNPQFGHQNLPIDHPHQYESEHAANMQNYQIGHAQTQDVSTGQSGLSQHIPQDASSNYSLPFPEVTTMPDVYQAQQQNPSYTATQNLEQPFPHKPHLYPTPPLPSSQQHQQLYPPQQLIQVPSPRLSPVPLQGENETSQSHYGPAPPPIDSLNPKIPAPRTYHRMVLDFSTLKSIFLTAKAQPHPTDLTPLASKLKSLAREIWTLRFSRAQEFTTSSNSAHEQIITTWKAEFELWSDVLDDLVTTNPGSQRNTANYDAATATAELASEFAQLIGLEGPAAGAPVKRVVKKVGVAATAAAVGAGDEDEVEVKPAVVKKVVKKAAAVAAADGEAAVAKPVLKKKVAVKKAAAAAA